MKRSITSRFILLLSAVAATSIKAGCGARFEVFFVGVFKLLKSIINSLRSPESEGSKKMTAHILLIEDQVNLARFIELELKCEGYRVSVAHDGRTGLTLMQQSAPNLVILDLVLPRLSGLEVCRHFRAIAHSSH